MRDTTLESYARVAEGFRRQPAELLYVGSTPIPGSKTSPLGFRITVLVIMEF